MAGTPIGGLRVDLQLNSAAFIRDIAKTNQAISSNTKAMQTSLTRLRTTANSVGAAFGGWLTLRAARRVISFLDQSIELAAKLDNELGKSARAFEMQGAAMKNAFQLGLAKGFLDVLSGGVEDSQRRLEQLAKAGIVVGKVLAGAFIVVVDVFTILIPEAINLSIQGINKFIEGANKVLEWGQKLDNLFGLNKDYGQAPLIPTIEIGQGANALFDLSSAATLASDATNLASESQKKLGESVKSTSDKIIEQLDAMDKLRQKNFEASIETTQQWLQVGDTLGQALGTMFKENKAVAIAQAVINTAQAITEALKLPFPINWAQVAAVTALGAAQIATISSTNPGGSSKAIKKGSGGGGKTQKAVTETSTSSGGNKNGQAINITLQGEGGFNREQVRALIGQINSAVGDGATLRVSG
jgi:hypothetical protein